MPPQCRSLSPPVMYEPSTGRLFALRWQGSCIDSVPARHVQDGSGTNDWRHRIGALEMWTKTADGSIVDDGGRIIYFSTERFVRNVCGGRCCFICGAASDDKPFSDEHVFPEWLLRRFGIFSSRMTLPNKAEFRYTRYKVRCCAECNAMMGELVEKPVSEVVSGGAGAINRFVENGGLLKIFVWMGLIFLKLGIHFALVSPTFGFRGCDDRRLGPCRGPARAAPPAGAVGRKAGHEPANGGD